MMYAESIVNLRVPNGKVGPQCLVIRQPLRPVPHRSHCAWLIPGCDHRDLSRGPGSPARHFLDLQHKVG